MRNKICYNVIARVGEADGPKEAVLQLARFADSRPRSISGGRIYHHYIEFRRFYHEGYQTGRNDC